jgi:hypothetical protein
MLTKKQLLVSLKGKKIIIKTHSYNSAIDIGPESRQMGGGTYPSLQHSHILTNVGEELFEATGYAGQKEYFSISHVRHVTL